MGSRGINMGMKYIKLYEGYEKARGVKGEFTLNNRKFLSYLDDLEYEYLNYDFDLEFDFESKQTQKLDGVSGYDEKITFKVMRTPDWTPTSTSLQYLILTIELSGSYLYTDVWVPDGNFSSHGHDQDFILRDNNLTNENLISKIDDIIKKSLKVN